MSAPAGNRTLSQAKRAKQDEFYTQLPDIANELRHYKKRLDIWTKEDGNS